MCKLLKSCEKELRSWRRNSCECCGPFSTRWQRCRVRFSEGNCMVTWCFGPNHGKIGKDPRHCGSSATVYLLVGTVLLPWCPQELKMREVQLLSDSTTSAGLLRLGMNGMNRESIVSLSDRQELAVTKSQLATSVRVRVPFLNGEKLLTRHEDRGITWTVWSSHMFLGSGAELVLHQSLEPPSVPMLSQAPWISLVQGRWDHCKRTNRLL